MKARAVILASIVTACGPHTTPPAPVAPGGASPTEPVTVDDAPDEPPATPPETNPPSEMPMPTHTLDLRSAVDLDRETTLRVEDVIIETIEASPDGDYPSGSGVDVVVIFQRGSYEQKVPLTLLSEGYDSRPIGWFQPYRVTLLDVADPDRKPKVSLVVERVTDRADGRPAKHRVKKTGEVQIDADTRLLFKAHGHKRTMAGQSSPLMVEVDWLVRGYEAEAQSINVGADRDAMAWTWRRWRVAVEEYEYDQWMELMVQPLVLERVESR